MLTRTWHPTAQPSRPVTVRNFLPRQANDVTSVSASWSRIALGCGLAGPPEALWLLGGAVTFLPGLQGEAAAGKMADGKAGEEKPEKPQRAGAAGGEHNPSVAGCGGYSGLSFEFPRVGGFTASQERAELAFARLGAGP